MRLKSLELVGFKSFFEQTNISFAPGVTAVVGRELHRGFRPREFLEDLSQCHRFPFLPVSVP